MDDALPETGEAESPEPGPQALMDQAADLLTDAMAMDGEGNRLKRQASSLHLQVRELNIRAVEAVRSGITTGDELLDLVIALAGHPVQSPAENVDGERLPWLMERVAAHPGECMVVNEHSRPILAIVSPSGHLHYVSHNRSGYSGHGLAATTALQVSISNSWRSVINRPITFDASSVGFLLSPVHRDTSVMIGDEVVTEWLSQQDLPTRLYAWAAARRLSHFYDPDPELAIEIRRRCDDLIPQLIQAYEALKAVKRLLADWRGDPLRYLQHMQTQRKSPGLTATDTGVQIDFGLSNQIAEAVGKLQALLVIATEELLMPDNAALQAARAELGDTQS